LSASTKEEFLKQKELFLSPAAMKKPVIFEIFIDDYHDEEKAWEIITSAEQDKNLIRKKNIINGIKAVVGDKGIHIAKKIIGKE
jgi:hypothetical protein